MRRSETPEQTLLPEKPGDGEMPCQTWTPGRSLLTGERVSNPRGRRTICDAIMTPTPNEHTFEINRKLLAGGLAASDHEVRKAMRFAFDRFKIVIEPGAAVGIAAVLNRRVDMKGRTVAVFTTGGNVAPARYCELLSGTDGTGEAAL